MTSSGSPYSTGAHCWRNLGDLPGRGARIWFITFIASMMQQGLAFLDLVADPHERVGAPGSGSR